MTWATPHAVLLLAMFAAISAVDDSIGSVALRLPAFNDSARSHYASLSSSDSGSDPGDAYEFSGSAEGCSGSCKLGAWLRRLTGANAGEGSNAGGWWLGWAWGADATVSVVDRSSPVELAARPASFGRAIEDPVMGYGIPMNAFTVPCEDIGDDEDETGGGGDGRDRERVYRGVGSRRVWALADAEKENLGCPRLCPAGAHMPSSEEAWIAIVQRGRCSFVEKVSSPTCPPILCVCINVS